MITLLLLNALLINELKVENFALLTSKVLTETSGDFDLDQAIRMYPTHTQVDAHKAAVEQYRIQAVQIFKRKY